MEAREKRIDLRLGAFACSLQGFDDPIPPLTCILKELRDVQAAMPDAGRPLFDAETLQRLEGEIAALAGGGVSAMPGLVLAPDAGAEEEAPAAPAEETTETTGADPDSGPPAQPESEAPEHAEQGAGIPLAPAESPYEPSPAAGETEEGSAADLLAAREPSPHDETEAEAPDRSADIAEVAEQVEAPLEPQPEETADQQAAPQDREEQGNAAAAANLFAAESDDVAAPGTAANLFDDAEPVLPEADAPPASAPSADEAPGWEIAAAAEVEPDANLFAGGAEQDPGAGGAVENLFGGPDAEVTEAGAAAEAADAASASPEPPAANEGEAPRAAGPESAPAPGDAGPGDRATDEPGARSGRGEGAEVNLFAQADEEEAVAINLFDDDAPPEGGGAAASDEDSDSDDAPIRPGAFRSLDRFNPQAPAPRDEDDLPPPRSYEAVSAAELAKRARAEAPAELMAAAAAWLTVVKGHGSFTKREVLELFEAFPGDHPRTAEAKVKGFGRLVRNGQVKLGDDQRFRLTEAERDRYEALLE